MSDFARLREQLGQISTPKTIDDEARLVLAYTLELAQPLSVRRSSSISCPNCGTQCTTPRSPYCSAWCREEASVIRQFRSNLSSGSIFDPEKQAVFGQILWWLIGGGYPRRVAMVEPRSRAAALKSTAGLCDCGNPATTFDHKGSACNRSLNLRPVCQDCAKTRPFMDPELLAKARSTEILVEAGSRMAAEVAVRECDDFEAWDWRTFLAARASQMP